MAATSSCIALDDNTRLELLLKKYQENPTQIPDENDLVLIKKLFEQYHEEQKKRSTPLPEIVPEVEKALYKKICAFYNIFFDLYVKQFPDILKSPEELKEKTSYTKENLAVALPIIFPMVKILFGYDRRALSLKLPRELNRLYEMSRGDIPLQDIPYIYDRFSEESHLNRPTHFRLRQNWYEWLPNLHFLNLLKVNLKDFLKNCETVGSDNVFYDYGELFGQLITRDNPQFHGYRVLRKSKGSDLGFILIGPEGNRLFAKTRRGILSEYFCFQALIHLGLKVPESELISDECGNHFCITKDASRTYMKESDLPIKKQKTFKTLQEYLPKMQYWWSTNHIEVERKMTDEFVQEMMSNPKSKNSFTKLVLISVALGVRDVRVHQNNLGIVEARKGDKHYKKFNLIDFCFVPEDITEELLKKDPVQFILDRSTDTKGISNPYYRGRELRPSFIEHHCIYIYKDMLAHLKLEDFLNVARELAHPKKRALTKQGLVLVQQPADYYANSGDPIEQAFESVKAHLASLVEKKAIKENEYKHDLQIMIDQKNIIKKNLSSMIICLEQLQIKELIKLIKEEKSNHEQILTQIDVLLTAIKTYPPTPEIANDFTQELMLFIETVAPFKKPKRVEALSYLREKSRLDAPIISNELTLHLSISIIKKLIQLGATIPFDHILLATKLCCSVNKKYEHLHKKFLAQLFIADPSIDLKKPLHKSAPDTDLYTFLYYDYVCYEVGPFSVYANTVLLYIAEDLILLLPRGDLQKKTRFEHIEELGLVLLNKIQSITNQITLLDSNLPPEFEKYVQLLIKLIDTYYQHSERPRYDLLLNWGFAENNLLLYFPDAQLNYPSDKLFVPEPTSNMTVNAIIADPHLRRAHLLHDIRDADYVQLNAVHPESLLSSSSLPKETKEIKALPIPLESKKSFEEKRTTLTDDSVHPDKEINVDLTPTILGIYLTLRYFLAKPEYIKHKNNLSVHLQRLMSFIHFFVRKKLEFRLKVEISPTSLCLLVPVYLSFLANPTSSLKSSLLSVIYEFIADKDEHPLEKATKVAIAMSDDPKCASNYIRDLMSKKNKKEVQKSGFSSITSSSSGLFIAPRRFEAPMKERINSKFLY